MAVAKGSELEGRCMKCKLQRPFAVDEVSTLKNGARMAKGKCSICSTTICKMLKKDA